MSEVDSDREHDRARPGQLSVVWRSSTLLSRLPDATVSRTGSVSSSFMEQMFMLVYNELRQLAAHKLRGERDGHTLSTTALVHEAWLELSKLNRIQWKNRGHFLAVAAQAMRRVLI